MSELAIVLSAPVGWLERRRVPRVLGTLLVTFLYCLLVLGRVCSKEEGDFLPHLAVSVAALLAAVCVGVLIYYIHHISTMVQAPNIVAALGQDLAGSASGCSQEKKADKPRRR